MQLKLHYPQWKQKHEWKSLYTETCHALQIITKYFLQNSNTSSDTHIWQRKHGVKNLNEKNCQHTIPSS